MATAKVSQCVVVQSSKGLHIRPSEIVAKAAMQFESNISIELEGHTVDAKSILHIMTLGAQQGCEVKVVAEGADAQQAVQRMVQLIGADLDSDQSEQVTKEHAG